MVKFIKQGRVVLLTNGRFAGKKAIIVKTYEEGSKERNFPHALVAGIQRHPKKVHKRMSQAKIAKRYVVQPFIKFINYQHFMPTRYTIPNEIIDPKTLVTEQQMIQLDTRKTVRKELKSIFTDKFANPPTDKTGKVSKDFMWLRTKLRF
eukprot:Platyproteum_vivax@DN470_c0_g1_i1.p1